MVIHNGTLDTQHRVRHLEVGGKEAEESGLLVKEKNDWTYPKWAKQVTRVLIAIENAIWPDLFISAGGAPPQGRQMGAATGKPHTSSARGPCTAAGIVGAAMASVVDTTHRNMPARAVLVRSKVTMVSGGRPTDSARVFTLISTPTFGQQTLSVTHRPDPTGSE